MTTAPSCPRCHAKTLWIPQVGRMDAGGGSTFTPFTFQELQRDGTHRERTVDSVHTLRMIERDSEQHARNGEGERVAFRAWSQEDSNREVNCFGPDPSVAARAELAATKEKLASRRGSVVTAEHGEVS